MGRSQATRTEAREFEQSEIRGIRRQLQILELQLQRLNQNVAPEAAAHSPAEEPPAPVTYSRVRALIDGRSARNTHFPGELFSDPAWDILLELYACELAHTRMNVSQLCVAAAMPLTTALRWLAILEKADLIVRTDHPFDRRQRFVSLTEQGLSNMRAYFEEVPLV